MKILDLRSQVLYVVVVMIVACSCNNNKTSVTEKFIESGYMDSSVKPGDNFFKFVNGKWLDTAKIPETESGIGAAYDVYNRTRDHLHELLDSVSKTSAKKGSIEQQ